MMKQPRAAVAAVLLPALARARITGFAVPAVIKPGDAFNAVIHSSDYIQTVYDVAIAFGYSAGRGYPESLGAVADSFFLGPDRSNQPRDFSERLSIPDSASKGQTLVTASLMSLYGAAHMPTLTNYNVSVTLGDETSETYVSSHQQ